MKKIISLALMLVMLLSMASCGKMSGINKAVEKSEPTTITTLVEYVGAEDTLKGKFVTQLDRSAQLAVFNYSKERYALLEELLEDRIITEAGSVLYNIAEDKMTADGGNTWTQIQGEVGGYTLNIKSKHLEEKEYSKDGNTVTGKLSSDKAKEALGTEITTDGTDIEITIITDGERVSGLNISYTSQSGVKVVSRTTYTYDAVDLSQAVVPTT